MVERPENTAVTRCLPRLSGGRSVLPGLSATPDLRDSSSRQSHAARRAVPRTVQRRATDESVVASGACGRYAGERVADDASGADAIR